MWPCPGSRRTGTTSSGAWSRRRTSDPRSKGQAREPFELRCNSRSHCHAHSVHTAAPQTTAEPNVWKTHPAAASVAGKNLPASVASAAASCSRLLQNTASRIFFRLGRPKAPRKTFRARLSPVWMRKGRFASCCRQFEPQSMEKAVSLHTVIVFCLPLHGQGRFAPYCHRFGRKTSDMIAIYITFRLPGEI